MQQHSFAKGHRLLHLSYSCPPPILATALVTRPWISGVPAIRRADVFAVGREVTSIGDVRADMHTVSCGEIAAWRARLLMVTSCPVDT